MMNQKDIMALLVEAITAEPRRVNEIHVLLEHAAHGGDEEILSIDDRGAGIRVVLGSLFVHTYQENPALLPTLFPAFAIMCGDMDGTIVADIDWSVYKGVETNKVRPAIYRFPIIDWGWVRLGELAQIMSMKPSEVLEHFGALSKDAPQYGVLAVTDGTKLNNQPLSEIIATAKHFEETGKFGIAGAIYVPAGWASDVLKAHSEGYTRVALEEMYLTEDDKNEPNWLAITHNTGFDNSFWVAVGYRG